MPSITFIAASGAAQTLDVPLGDTLMQAALQASVPGVLGECGGSLACGTCHIHIDGAWLARLPAADPMELDMVEGLEHSGPNSRLACQISMTEALAGLVVRVPAETLP
jgi:ferredoxin, 2Fe-2S